MKTFRYLFALTLFPFAVSGGFCLGWPIGVGVTILLLLALAIRARKLGSSVGTILAGLGRSYLVAPRMVGSLDLRAARRASGAEGISGWIREGATDIYSDLPEIEAREMVAAVRQAHAALVELLPTSKPVDRVLIFAKQRDMQAYLKGWFGMMGPRGAGFFFVAGPSRVVVAVDAFEDLGRNPRALVAHELVHGALRGVSGYVLHHRWLDEGLAEALALTWFEPARRAGIERYLRRLRSAGQWYDFRALVGWKAGQVVKGLKEGSPETLLRVHAFYAQACALMLEVLDMGPDGLGWLRAALAKPGKAKRYLRERLDMDGEALVARLAARVDRAPLALTPWDRVRRAKLRGLLAGQPASPFRAVAVMGLGACGDADDLPLLRELAGGEDEEMAAVAKLVVGLIEGAEPPPQGG